MVDALFRRLDDDRVEPTELSRGPWDPNACHGGPVSALLAGAMAAEAATLEVEWFPARCSIELQRPVTLSPITVATSVRRPGRKVAVVEGRLLADDGTVLLAGVLQCIRSSPVDAPAPDDVAPVPPPSEGQDERATRPTRPIGFAGPGTEHRFVAGSFDGIGPATDWIRLRHAVVEGRPVTPLERVVAAADFGNGISRLFDMDQALFINPDLTVALHRLPVGEWVCLDSVTRFGPDGVGMAESLLRDEHGPIGRSIQTLLLERP